jgi:putative CocE/NonD family hydrolase
MPLKPTGLRTFALLLVAGLLPVLPASVHAEPAAAPAEVHHVRVPSHDGVVLDGWLVLPQQAVSGRVPVVLWSAPYFGQCDYYPFPTNNPPPRCSYATGDNPELWDNSTLSESVPVNLLLEHGYAVAIFNVRGTGNSGGCFSWFGRAEQKDQSFLVEWLAAQPWSNGKVGMMGLSYHGTTPWEAAIQNPPHLKTIVVAGMIGDAYLFSHTPQGATFTTIGVFDNNFVIRTSLSPPIKGSPQHATVEHIPVAPERICPDLLKFMTEDVKGTFTDLRDRAFWEERRLIDRFPEIRSSVLLTHGFQDLWLSGHQMQEDAVWKTLRRAPKRMLVGQWGHEFPNFNHFRPEWAMADWNDRLIAWLDPWLKPRNQRTRGLPSEPARIGVVEYQDGTGAWHRSTAWPPKEAHDEVLYLASGALASESGGDSATFRSYPQWEKLATPEHLLCPSNLLSDALGPGGVRYVTEPATEPTVIAGNPHAYLKLTSDMPGGLVGVHLFDLAPGFRCDSDVFAEGARKLATGVADLRFHKGSYAAADFPVGAPTHVRIDITNLAEVIEPGHRLAVAVSWGDPLERNGQPRFARLTVHADGGAEASHLVVPVVGGSLGGSAPTVTYPPRPFVPQVP